MTPALAEAFAALDLWLKQAALPLWWENGADHENGGFYEMLDLQGRPVQAERRARVLSRQIFVYAASARLGWTGPWREAVTHGLDALQRSFLRPDGFTRRAVSAEGTPADDQATLYEQAFVLFALAEARRAVPERGDLRTLAIRILEGLEAGRRHPAGGFVELGSQHAFQSNPHMHLFEAALAWSEVDDDRRWPALADELGQLCLDRFIDPDSGVLREFFDAQWRPAPGLAGRLVSPGHQFEWAWLLERWGGDRRRNPARAAAERLYDLGLRGVDRLRNVAMDELLDDLTVQSAGARLWPQTERLKAALRLGASDRCPPERRAAFAEEALNAVKGLSQYLDMTVEGLWRDKMLPEGDFVEEPAPASSFYHIVVAIDELRIQTQGSITPFRLSNPTA